MSSWVNSLKDKVSSWLPPSKPGIESELTTVARQARLLAVLLEAGLSSTDAVDYTQRYEGLTTSGAIPASPHAFVVTIWNLVRQTGAPPAQLLRTCAEALEAAAENARVARVHLAGPRAATRLVMTLPVFALLGAVVTGYSPFSFLFLSPLGWGLLLVASGLVWLAAAWSARMVRGAQHWEWARGMSAEVMALLLRAGSSTHHAREWAELIARDYCTDSTHSNAELRQCDVYVSLAQSTGVSLSSLLRSVAQHERSAAREQAHERTEKLSVSLMLPLGLCILPAFIAVGVVPIVVSIISSTALATR
jgi:tight adherence protein B